jgi:hypothetical protein
MVFLGTDNPELARYRAAVRKLGVPAAMRSCARGKHSFGLGRSTSPGAITFDAQKNVEP